MPKGSQIKEKVEEKTESPFKNKGLRPVPDVKPLRDIPLSSKSQDEGRDPFYRRVIPVGTATPGRAIKLRDLATVPVVVESDPTVTTVTASTVSTTETDLASFRFFKDEFYREIAIRITAIGTYTSDGTRTMTLRIGRALAPTTEWNSMISTAAVTTNAPWHLVWYGIVGTIGASGTLEAQMTGKINNVNKDDANAATVAFPTTATLIIALTAQWSANDAGNSISLRQFIVETLN